MRPDVVRLQLPGRRFGGAGLPDFEAEMASPRGVRRHLEFIDVLHADRQRGIELGKSGFWSH